jgi:hypothetical protein
VRGPEGAFDEPLGRWVDAKVLRGKEPFDAWAVLRGLGTNLVPLVRDLHAAAMTVATIDEHEPADELSAAFGAFVPRGPSFARRVVHAGLYTDRVYAELPRLTPGRSEREPDDRTIERYLQGGFEAVVEDLGGLDSPDLQDWELEDVVYPGVSPSRLDSMIAETARNWLEFAWTIRRPCAEGWLQIVGPEITGTRGRPSWEGTALREDKDFLAALKARELPWDPYERYDTVDAAFAPILEVERTAALSRALRFQVVSLPASAEAAQFLKFVARYYRLEDYPPDEDAPLPPRSATVFGVGEVLRGAWYDELLISLGPITERLDGSSVCAVRSAGVAAELKRFVSDDLSRLVRADLGGADLGAALADVRTDLQGIAERAVEAAASDRSAAVRKRLAYAVVSGTGSAITGLLTGGSAAGALIGFAVAAATAAVTAGSSAARGPEQVLIDVWRATDPPRSAKVVG